MSRKDGSMKKWNPNGGFPTAEQLERMVAAEVKHLAEAALQRQQAKTERSEARRDRLRKVYWRQVEPTGQKVDLETIFAVVGRDRWMPDSVQTAAAARPAPSGPAWRYTAIRQARRSDATSCNSTIANWPSRTEGSQPDRIQAVHSR